MQLMVKGTKYIMVLNSGCEREKKKFSKKRGGGGGVELIAGG